MILAVFPLNFLGMLSWIAYAYPPSDYPHYPLPQRRVDFAGHLIKLTEAEKREVRDYCDVAQQQQQHVLMEAAQRKREPQNRIIGGETLEHGVPYAAVILVNNGRKCGATFISSRHLLSARHCFDFMDKTPDDEMSVLAGGVCYQDSTRCVTPGGKKDMVDVQAEFVIFEETPKKGLPGVANDMAIIQLKTAIPHHLRDRVGFACLPPGSSRDLPPPEILTVHGWGLTNAIASPTTMIGHNLKQINLTSIDDAGMAHTINICQPSAISICLHPLRLISPNDDDLVPFHESTFKGDSGSGAVDVEAPRPTIYGIDSSHKRTSFNVYTAFVDVRKYLDDICYYLDLCVNGAEPKYANFMPDVLYYMHLEHSHYRKSAFKTISDAENDAINRRCAEQKQRGQFPSRVGWAAAIVDGNGEFACSATFVTRQHLITTRSCFMDRILLRDKFKPQRDSFYVAAGGECLENFLQPNKTNCPHISSQNTTEWMFVGFIALSSAKSDQRWIRDLAIIELRNEVSMVNASKRAFPICINPSAKDHWQPNSIYRSYAWGRKYQPDVRTPQDFYVREMANNGVKSKEYDALITQITSTDDLLTQPLTKQDKGVAVVDPANGEMVGLFMGTLRDNDNFNIVYPAPYFHHVLCVFLNRCVRNTKYYLLPLHYFDHFFVPYLNGSGESERFIANFIETSTERKIY